MNIRPLVAIVAAAGGGERLGRGEPKALVECAGRPLVEWSLEPLAALCDRVVVALPAGSLEAQFSRAAALAERVAGGASRSESVLAAVRASPEAHAYVVHDAARPLLTQELIERCVGEVGHGWGGAVAAAPMTDTVKEAGAGGEVVRTLDRGTLWAVQTPQAFQAALLRRALDVDPALLAEATDDASLVEAVGGSVRVVESTPQNIKVTLPADLAAAEAALEARLETAPRS
jgi:2-C-methyl-D-erythritol 4-phosphate cytidylyltransferase